MNDFSVVLILFLFVYNFTSSFNFDSVLYILSTKVRLYCCHLMRVCDFRTHSRQVTVCLAESCVLFYALFWKLKFATLKYTCGEKVFGVRGQINFCRGQCELCISPSIKLSWIHDETSFENCFLFSEFLVDGPERLRSFWSKPGRFDYSLKEIDRQEGDWRNRMEDGFDNTAELNRLVSLTVTWNVDNKLDKPKLEFIHFTIEFGRFCVCGRLTQFFCSF